MPRKTLVVAGELDRITPLAESTLITRLVADGELVVVKDSSHLPNLENPVEFNEVLVRFLDSLGAEVVVEVDAEADSAS
jgi:pimeloyl-ACP methyl ester carboxylesterase